MANGSQLNSELAQESALDDRLFVLLVGMPLRPLCASDLMAALNVVDDGRSHDEVHNTLGRARETSF